MLLIGAVFIGVILGYLHGGRITYLASLRLRFWGLIVVALLIQLFIFPLFSRYPLLLYATTELHLLSYGLVFLFLALNYRTFPLLFIGLGALLNLLAIAVNGGYMPSSQAALSRAGSHELVARLIEEGRVGNIMLMSEKTRLNALGDFLYLPKGIPLAAAFSIGDLIVALGLVWLIVWGMESHV
ncbi:DUF5317 domain-containing protein [Candidatus Bipolaricaulota bacterium]|nr:DUF5317 domain-containing protein [Candidatus Bipolaricaulota bacterium]